MALTTELSDLEARSIALTAQGFGSRRRPPEVGTASMRREIGRLGLLQIDSVNVLVRAHYLPLFSRLGPYDRGVLDDLAVASSKCLFEYWGHEASLLPIDLHPLLRWRMDRAREGRGVWSRLGPFAGERRAEADALLARIGRDGPLAASDVSGPRASKGMWVWSDAKHALEWLFWAGLVASTHRRGSFERVYDLPERVLQRSVLARPTPDPVDARRELVARAAEALGVATANDLRDYYRLSPADARLPIEQLVEAGVLVPVTVRGWQQQAYLHRDARPSRRHGRAALLSPFDPLVWHRPRIERLFGFRYRLEIYTPAHRREHGYYVLPFLMDGALVARVDLKADRKAGALMVLRAHLEPAAPAETIERLLGELGSMAAWLGLSGVVVPQTAGLESRERPAQSRRGVRAAR
ncbi:winged helix DNA-binding domain-containing protein (plasmid) [Methylobacterium sp. NMS14P]|uniref:winged helix-turn-helix domain-containing protein n=1 Tax=Methylobacterium sp. NMS14P TaxID=2894310 RepID=UPI002359F1DC|nr:crosslink repair DNA glycosylase YcaQ family protein [Methylobacterium sp. NMS14P]WCS28581.1 winged helix DNA-binding domain-containing protein [Methylobacterium sp. NMS14P]